MTLHIKPVHFTPYICLISQCPFRSHQRIVSRGRFSRGHFNYMIGYFVLKGPRMKRPRLTSRWSHSPKLLEWYEYSSCLFTWRKPMNTHRLPWNVNLLCSKFRELPLGALQGARAYPLLLISYLKHILGRLARHPKGAREISGLCAYKKQNMKTHMQNIIRGSFLMYVFTRWWWC